MLCHAMYHYWFFGLLRERGTSTTFFHLPLSLALVLASSHGTAEFRSSQFRLLLQVCFGRSLLLFFREFHSCTCLVIFLESFLRLWPTHRHFRYLIWTFIGCWFVNVHSLASSTLSNYPKRRICQRQPLTKFYIFAVLILIALQVSDFPLELKILSLVLAEILFALHTGRCLSIFLPLALMSSFVWLVLLPKYTKSSTFVTAFPETVNEPSCWLLMHNNLVFSRLISKPTFCAVILRLLLSL